MEPLGPAGEAVFDERLIGSWELLHTNGKAVLTEAPIVLSQFNDAEYLAGPLALGDEFLDLEKAARMYITTIDGHRFVNVQYLEEREYFYFARLEMSGNDALQLRLLEEDVFPGDNMSASELTHFLAENAEDPAIYARHGLMRYRKISDDRTIAPPTVDEFEVEFGILFPRPFGVRNRTTTIPLDLCESFRFGFYVRPPDSRSYAVRTVHHFPAVPKVVDGQTLDPGPPATLQYPARTARGPRRVAYGFNEGDPLGPYRMELYLNDELHTAIDYTVVELERPMECVPMDN